MGGGNDIFRLIYQFCSFVLKCVFFSGMLLCFLNFSPVVPVIHTPKKVCFYAKQNQSWQATSYAIGYTAVLKFHTENAAPGVV